ncbi:MAG TPA: S41 family peptidase [Afifellaceae bacterium]|nr:S41 family peptidase [Afifellaceae bacterium]
MKRQLSLVAIGAIFGALALGSASQLNVFSEATAANTDTYRQLNLFGDVFERVRADYVEEPSESELIEAAVEGMLSSLDPHSSYLNAKSFDDMRTTTRGEFGGLGIEVTMENDLIKVVTPIDDTPAARAGVQPGDLISHLDGEQVLGLSLREAVDKMRGPINSPIVLTVIREGAEAPLEIKIVRDIIRIRSVRHRVEKDVGYVRITQFNEKTSEGLSKAIKEINAEVPAEELKGYILDLRNNPGGLLDQAISVSDAFLDRGEIVSTRGRQADDTQRYSARPGDDVKGKPVIILVNGGSASASEIVAGALQDHRRATVVGSRSFGKGSVQTIIPLGRNGAIRLTTARYYTPAGRSIQAKGVVPDIEVIQELPDELKGTPTTTEGESGLRGHLTVEGEDEEEQSGSSAYVPPDPKDDAQINFALDLLRGIKQHAMFPPDPSQGIPN